MSFIESGRLHVPRRERAIKIAIATLAVPAAGLLLRREMSLRKEKAKGEEGLGSQQEAARQEAILVFRDSVNSGNSGFDFSKDG